MCIHCQKFFASETKVCPARPIGTRYVSQAQLSSQSSMEKSSTNRDYPLVMTNIASGLS